MSPRDAPHRDELGAALGRIAALERELSASDLDSDEKARELEALRAEVVLLRERVGAADKRPPEHEPRSPKETSRRGGPGLRIGLAVLVMGGVVAAAVLLPRCLAERAARNDPGRLYQAHVVRTLTGQSELLITSGLRTKPLSLHFWRLDLIDLQSGRRRVRKLIDPKDKLGRPEVLAACPGRVWVAFRRSNRLRLELRTVADLALVEGFEQLHGSIDVDRAAGHAIVTTRTGDRLIIDPKTGRARAFTARELLWTRKGMILVATAKAAGIDLDGATRLGRRAYSTLVARTPQALRRRLWQLPKVVRLGQSQRGTTSSGYDGAVTYTFRSRAGLPKQVLTRDNDQALPQASDLLQPQFVTAYGTGYALTLPGLSARGAAGPGPRSLLSKGRGPLGPPRGEPDRGGFIITHAPTLGSRYEVMRLSRIGLDGRLVWTLEQPRGRVNVSLVAGARVVIASGAGKNSGVVAIDWRTGKMAWRYTP